MNKTTGSGTYFYIGLPGADHKTIADSLFPEEVIAIVSIGNQVRSAQTIAVAATLLLTTAGGVEAMTPNPIFAYPNTSTATTSLVQTDAKASPKMVSKTQARFDKLAAQWAEETGRFSTTLQKVTHPAYQQIIGLGPQAVPLIMNELAQGRNHWFWALRAITGEDPTRAGDTLQSAIEAWQSWYAAWGLSTSGIK